MEVKDVADNLYLENGIWFSNNKSEISYPKEGNISCYEIEKDSFWFNHRNNCIIEAVKIHSPNEIFFDIGGGNGFVAKGLNENNIQSVLIEPGIEGALNAKRRGLKDIICATFQDAGIKKNSCNAIGLFDVVEHIEDDQLFLKSINSILAKEGLVYITVPAYNILWSKEDTDAGHYKRYSIQNMSSVLKKAGFEIVYSTYIFSILPIPVFLFRTIPSKLKLNKNSNDVNKHKNAHSQKKGILTALLDKIWDIELTYIKRKRKIPIGGSCFVIARKTVSNIV
jgi:2-polyprenyl-3-methyl-5-hydroxy-6-metoxy-1,4-benzoquinol methylase